MGCSARKDDVDIMKIRIIALIVAIGFVVAFSPRAYSAPILEGIWETTTQGTWNTPTGDPDGRDATAVFSIDGNDLKIVLTNLADLTDENDELLMGLFFGFGDTFSGTLTSPSVAANSGSLQTYNSTIDTIPYNTDGSINLDGEFGYLTGINDINGGRGDYGISSSGLDPDDTDLYGWDGFGVNTIIDHGYVITTPLAPNGPDFGITGLNNWEGSNALAYINNSVIITWQGASGYDYDLHDIITQVHFLYGTDYDYDYDNVTAPEPTTMLLLGSGLIGLGWFGKRRAKKVGLSGSSAKLSFETKDMT